METNRVGGVKATSTGKKKDVFNGFEYICSRYTLADELRKKVCWGWGRTWVLQRQHFTPSWCGDQLLFCRRVQEREESEAKRKAVSGKDFVPSDTRSKLLHEDAFGAKVRSPDLLARKSPPVGGVTALSSVRLAVATGLSIPPHHPGL